jgi:hypothetical protein
VYDVSNQLGGDERRAIGASSLSEASDREWHRPHKTASLLGEVERGKGLGVGAKSSPWHR